MVVHVKTRNKFTSREVVRINPPGGVLDISDICNLRVPGYKKHNQHLLIGRTGVIHGLSTGFGHDTWYYSVRIDMPERPDLDDDSRTYTFRETDLEFTGRYVHDEDYWEGHGSLRVQVDPETGEGTILGYTPPPLQLVTDVPPGFYVREVVSIKKREDRWTSLDLNIPEAARILDSLVGKKGMVVGVNYHKEDYRIYKVLMDMDSTHPYGHQVFCFRRTDLAVTDEIRPADMVFKKHGKNWIVPELVDTFEYPDEYGFDDLEDGESAIWECILENEKKLYEK